MRSALHYLSLMAVMALCACAQDEVRTPMRTGPWLLQLHLGEQALPVYFEHVRLGDDPLLIVHNGDEKLEVTDIEWRNDTIFVRMPLYDSEFIGYDINDSTFTGRWHNYLKGRDYSIPFTAQALQEPMRFAVHEAPVADLSGQWESDFGMDKPKGYKALGLFEQREGRVQGTFVTETGDYRFLEGIMDGDSLKLSAFDGSHAFLFKAVLRNDSLIGRFWSGTHWQEDWVAVRNPGFTLRDPDSLTRLREGYDMVDFSFPDLEGSLRSPKDDRYREKVLLVQVMGSWCPNCVDETRLLNELYDTHHDKGLEVIAVAFEKYEEEHRALEALRQFKEKLRVPYAMVYAGMANKETAAAKLPFLEHIMSFPTCVFIDRQGTVRRIRTGFYGPGTGQHYVTYKRNLERFVEQLLNEPPSPILGQSTR